MNKKTIPLALLEATAEGKIEGITRFQKLVFLAQEEELHRTLYNFEPMDYGPFSSSLYEDIDRLVEEGFIRENKEPTSHPDGEDKQVYEITNTGKKGLIAANLEEDFVGRHEQYEEIIDKYNELDLWPLLEYVYEEYPDTAKNSKLKI